MSGFSQILSKVEIPVEITKSADHLHRTLDTLCHSGCTTVRDIIHKLEHHEVVPELVLFSHTDRHFILSELKNIMAVYEQ